MSSQCDVEKEACAETSADTECCGGPEKLLLLADEAWKELLKDKIKEEIEKSSGPKLSALAKLVAEANHQRWTYLITGKQKCEEFKGQVKEALLSLTK